MIMISQSHDHILLNSRISALYAFSPRRQLVNKSPFSILRLKALIGRYKRKSEISGHASNLLN